MKTPEQKEQLISELKRVPVIELACKKVGIGRTTYYRWRKEDEEFTKRADEALHEGSSLINDIAESQLMSAIRDKNMTAIIFWLKHHHPTYATRLELSGRLEHIHDDLTPEQEALVKKALELGSFHTHEEK